MAAWRLRRRCTMSISSCHTCARSGRSRNWKPACEILAKVWAGLSMRQLPSHRLSSCSAPNLAQYVNEDARIWLNTPQRIAHGACRARSTKVPVEAHDRHGLGALGRKHRCHALHIHMHGGRRTSAAMHAEGGRRKEGGGRRHDGNSRVRP